MMGSFRKNRFFRDSTVGENAEACPVGTVEPGAAEFAAPRAFEVAALDDPPHCNVEESPHAANGRPPTPGRVAQMKTGCRLKPELRTQVALQANLSAFGVPPSGGLSCRVI